MSAWSEGGQLDPRRSQSAMWADCLLSDLRWFKRSSILPGRLLILQVLIQGVGAATSFCIRDMWIRHDPLAPQL